MTPAQFEVIAKLIRSREPVMSGAVDLHRKLSHLWSAPLRLDHFCQKS